MATAARVPSVKQLVNQLLDQGFTRATAATIRAMTNGARSGLLATRLRQFEQEVSRLEATGAKLALNNPVLSALLSAFDDALRTNTALLNGSTLDLQTAAVNAANVLTRQLALPGITPQMMDVIGVQWNTPDPAAVARVVDYTAQDAWQKLLGDYSKELRDNAQQIAI